MAVWWGTKRAAMKEFEMGTLMAEGLAAPLVIATDVATAVMWESRTVAPTAVQKAVATVV